MDTKGFADTIGCVCCGSEMARIGETYTDTRLGGPMVFQCYKCSKCGDTGTVSRPIMDSGQRMTEARRLALLALEAMDKQGEADAFNLFVRAAGALIGDAKATLEDPDAPIGCRLNPAPGGYYLGQV